MEIEWEHMFRPDFDSSGTIAETWYALVDGYTCRIDRFADEYGGSYAYTVSYRTVSFLGYENVDAATWQEANDRIVEFLHRKDVP